MKTLFFCTSAIADHNLWVQRYQPWLEHHCQGRHEPSAIVLIDDGADFEPPQIPLLFAANIGQQDLPAEGIVRFRDALGQADTTDCPGWWRSFFAALCLAHHYGFERIINVESNYSIISDRLAHYLFAQTSGWTALWGAEGNLGISPVQVLCKDAYHLLEQLVPLGPFGLRGQLPFGVLPFTHVERGFLAERDHPVRQENSSSVGDATRTDRPFLPDSLSIARVAKKSPIRAVQLPREEKKQSVGVSPEKSSPLQWTADALDELANTFPYDAVTNCQLGILRYQAGEFAAARAALERADWIQPEQALTCKFLAATRMQQAEIAGAAAAAAQSARLNPDDAEAMNMAGAFHLQNRQAVAAIDYFRRALVLNPESSSTLSNLALIDWTQPEVTSQFPGGLREIEMTVRASLIERLRTNTLSHAGAGLLMGFGVHFREDFERLLQLARVLLVDLDTDAQALFASGNALIVAGDPLGALHAYQRASALAPDSVRLRNAVGYALICQGGQHFLEGFRIANDSWPEINPAAFVGSVPRWRGAHDSCKKLLVYQEQGIGDALLCLRFLPVLKQRAIDAVLWLRPELAQLVLGQVDIPLVEALARPEPAMVNADGASPLFGLIDALGMTIDQLPAPLIIRAPAPAVQSMRKKLLTTQRLRVGLCLFGNPNRADDWARSVPPFQCAVLASVRHIDWVNLSVDHRPERQVLKQVLPAMQDLTDAMSDFAATAGLIDNLDIVISIDSVIAHLAAAMGKPVFLIGSTIADWRWKIGEMRSPWWPTVEIFAADGPGRFESALASIARQIEQRTSYADSTQLDHSI